MPVGLRGPDLVESGKGVERVGTGKAEQMLGQHIERTLAQRRRVLIAAFGSRQGRLAFQHLEAVGWDQHGLGRLVHAVIGAADPLGQPACPLWSTDIDDKIDVAPVDAHVERGGRDNGPEAARGHRCFHLAPLADIERTVMQGNRQRVFVDAPEFLEHHLRLAAGVHKKQRDIVFFDELVDVADGIARGVAGPGHPFFTVEDRDIRLRAAGHLNHCGEGSRVRIRLVNQIGPAGHPVRPPSRTDRSF